MSPEQLKAQCEAALRTGKTISFTVPRGQSLPKGFPLGRLYSVTYAGSTYKVSPQRVLKWLRESLQDTPNTNPSEEEP